MVLVGQYPTPAHREAAEAIVRFAMDSPVESVLLVNSCARGVATPESDLDIALLVDPAEARSVEQAWGERYRSDSVFRRLEQLSRFACVHLDAFDGQWTPSVWDDGGGPDAFEIEIGNRVAHALPLWERGGAFSGLQARWLPFYADSLREERLRMVSRACSINIERVHAAVGRGLHFYAFDRLYHAFQEFLQAVFISRHVYPIAYNKWIREQVEDWLGLPALYAELPSILEVQRLDSGDLTSKADHLRRLLENFVVS